MHKLRFLAGSVLIIGCLFLLPVLPHLLWIEPTVKAAGVSNTSVEDKPATNNSPNAITRGMFQGGDALGRLSDSTEQALSKTSRSATNFVMATATTSGRFVAHGVASGAGLAARVVGGSFKFVAGGTSHVIGSISNVSGLANIIRPADNDNKDIPTIDSQLAALYSSQALSSTGGPGEQETNQSDSTAAWPIRGRVTTEFGVPHQPYQVTHTGLDISSGRPSGITKIKPFKPGRVADVIYSQVGLGNHLVIDHGGGLTSVYAHLASISVKDGQEVGIKTTLGYEGSTGASTGTHLHFEIRVNSQPVDPSRYIDGQP